MGHKASDIEARLIVGFETHVQLATNTKLFCGCAVAFGETPNSRMCPVCLGLPGALPVMNRRAFDFAVLTGLALGCKISVHTKWDRKSYYYPDLPKNYQISQYDLPLAHDGAFEIPSEGGSKRVGIIRAHLEEDAGKNLHDQGDYSLVDLNRAGTPLLEIVTRPEINSPDEAYVYCTELQRLVTYLGVSHGVMQKGQMRFEPNINVEITAGGQTFRTPISEVKNLNSFRSVRGAVEFEFRRQVQDWLADHDYQFKKRPNENRGWDDERGVTVFQREKEAAHDYRYFPDPDLVPVEVDTAWLNGVRESLPELPLARRMRFELQYGVTADDAATLVADRETADCFESAAERAGAPQTTAKQFLNVWSRFANDRGVSVGRLAVSAERMGELAAMVDQRVVSATAANQIAERMMSSSDEPRQLAESMGLVTVADEGQLDSWVAGVFAGNEKAVKDAIANPKKTQAAVGFLRGQVMKASGGKADPRLAGDKIEARLAAMRAG
ncbi:MAG: Asp-tRNA(Asn)/Glu-tRNA(Gln) amidotransferase subunit GatB [Phycisphaerales bacterium]|nr:Asp-tRNA(Asn)/Glu-tRNA(Gln) amidotransferase subunit GatB [Phycisphaerales bacterium]